MPSVFSRCFPGVSSRPRLRSRSSSRKRRFRREGRVSSRVSGFRCLLRPLPRSTCSPGLVLQRRSWDSAGARSRRPEREEAPRLLLCSKWAARGAWRPYPGVLSTLGAAPPGVCQDSSGHKTSVPPGNAVLGFLPLPGCLQPLLSWPPLPKTKGRGPGGESYLRNPQVTSRGVQLSKPRGDSLDTCLGDREHGHGWKYSMSNFSAQVDCCWDS